MYICTFLENRARHLNIPSKIRTSKNVHNNIFSTFGHFENKLYLVTNSPHFFVFFLLDILHFRLLSYSFSRHS